MQNCPLQNLQMLIRILYSVNSSYENLIELIVLLSPLFTWVMGGLSLLTLMLRCCRPLHTMFLFKFSRSLLSFCVFVLGTVLQCFFVSKVSRGPVQRLPRTIFICSSFNVVLFSFYLFAITLPPPPRPPPPVLFRGNLSLLLIFLFENAKSNPVCKRRLIISTFTPHPPGKINA